MTAKLFGQVVGVTLLLLGVGGLLLGDQLFGLLNIEILEDIIHLATGAIFIYVGFMARGSGARTIVGALGVVYLLVGVLGFVTPNLFGLLPNVGYTALDNIIHLAIGALGIFVGFMGPRDEVARARA